VAGDRPAFGALVERYAGVARRVAWAILGNADDADDAAQDAMLSALVKLDQYDPRRPFGPWLLRIVANAATDRRRRRSVRRTALVLFDVEGYSHAEIAAILGIPEGTVRSEVFHGRRRLRALLGDWKEEA
jgi:RNA polymerase sigma-70 factor (ECF subfamily)